MNLFKLPSMKLLKWQVFYGSVCWINHGIIIVRIMLFYCLLSCAILSMYLWLTVLLGF